VDTVSRDRLEDELLAYLLQRLDPHSHYIPNEDLARINEPLEGGFDGIGIQFNLRADTIYVASVIQGGPSERAGLKPGDRIIMVDGDTVAGKNITNRQVTTLLKGPRGSNVKVAIKRKNNAELVNTEIERGEIPIESIEAAFLMDDSTVYVRIARFSKHTYDEFMEEVHPLITPLVNGAVLDLRGNGGGYLDGAIKLADEFLKKGALITYTEGRSRPRMEYHATPAGKLENAALAVIIDGMSASASEILAGAVQDLDRGVIVGKRSFGKGLVQEQNEWNDGSATRLTVARYYTPEGRSIQRPYDAMGEEQTAHHSDSLLGGIVPQLEVERDTSGITWLYAEVVHRGLLTRFAYDFRDKQLTRLEKLTEEEFINTVSIEEIQKAMLSFLENELEQMNLHEWERSNERMALRAKGIIGRSLYGEEVCYRVVNPDDAFVRAALLSIKKRSTNQQPL